MKTKKKATRVKPRNNRVVPETKATPAVSRAAVLRSMWSE